MPGAGSSVPAACAAGFISGISSFSPITRGVPFRHIVRERSFPSPHHDTAVKHIALGLGFVCRKEIIIPDGQRAPIKVSESFARMNATNRF